MRANLKVWVVLCLFVFPILLSIGKVLIRDWVYDVWFVRNEEACVKYYSKLTKTGVTKAEDPVLLCGCLEYYYDNLEEQTGKKVRFWDKSYLRSQFVKFCMEKTKQYVDTTYSIF